ncbi:MAG: exosortase/archaeosortase family protein [Phycisphaerales bacterium]
MSRGPAWGFQDGLWLAGLCALAVAASFSAWYDMVQTGLRSSEQSHILLALPLVVWLAWLRRGRVRKHRPGRSLAGAGIALAGSVAFLVGPRLGYDIVWHAGALLMLAGGLVSIVGVRLAIAFFPSFIGLAFFLPVPGTIRHEIATPLQDVSARVGEFALDIFGVPVERTGSALTVNGVPVMIAEACNGMRMVSALALVSFAFIFSVPMSNRIRVLILAISPLVAVLVNIIRLIPTVLFYGYADANIAGAFHDASGWLGLVLAFGVLWAFLSMLRWLEVPIAPYGVRGGG